MKKLKFAIIGCGRISYKHVEALVNNREEAELVATCDVVLEKAEAKRDEYIESLDVMQIVFMHTLIIKKCLIRKT